MYRKLLRVSFKRRSLMQRRIEFLMKSDSFVYYSSIIEQVDN